MTLRGAISRLLPAVLGLFALIAISLHPPDLAPASPSAPHTGAVVGLHVTGTDCHHYPAGSASLTTCAAPSAILTAVAVLALPVGPERAPRPVASRRLTGRCTSCRLRPPILPA